MSILETSGLKTITHKAMVTLFHPTEKVGNSRVPLKDKDGNPIAEEVSGVFIDDSVDNFNTCKSWSVEKLINLFAELSDITPIEAWERVVFGPRNRFGADMAGKHQPVLAAKYGVAAKMTKDQLISAILNVYIESSDFAGAAEFNKRLQGGLKVEALQAIFDGLKK